MVLGGAAKHRRTADVDVFDGVVRSDVGLGDGGFKGVEVDADEVDGGDAVVGHRALVFRVVAQTEQPAVDERVERLDATVHHFGEAGDLVDRGDGDSRLFDRLGGAAGGDDGDAEAMEFLRERDEPVFIADGDQGTADGDELRRHEVVSLLP